MERAVQLFTRAGSYVGDAHVQMPDGRWPPAITVLNKTYVLDRGRYVQAEVTEATPVGAA